MTNPIEIFKQNWQIAKTHGDANAHYCTLATVSAAGQPSMRTLVLRGVTDDSFKIFINSSSVKWQHLQQSKNFELLVLWPSMMQQYRIRGDYTELPSEAMKAHWAKKPYDAKLLDHFYSHYQSQSREVESRAKILTGIEQLKERYPVEADMPFAENAKGLSIRATYIEVWRGSDSDRLHHRDLYELSNGVWQRSTLVS